jgi:hypothetical protein
MGTALDGDIGPTSGRGPEIDAGLAAFDAPAEAQFCLDDLGEGT